VKIGPVDPVMIYLKGFIFKMECTLTNLLNSGVTGQNLTKFTLCSQFIAFGPLKSEWRHSKPFWDARVTNKGAYANFANLTLKLVAMAMSLE